MKTEIKKVDKHKRKISVEIGAEAVSRKLEDVYNRIAKDAQVPGFRKGKAPRDVLEKHYKDFASQEIIKELVPESYNQAIEREALNVLHYPQISEVKLDNGILSFNALVEVKPEIIFKKDYKGIKVEYKRQEVSAQDLKHRLDALKESRKLDKLDDDFARGLGYPSLDDLESTMNKQIYLENENRQRIKMEEAVVNFLLENTTFDTPASLVQQQLNELVERQKIDLVLRGVPKEKVEEQEGTLRKNLQAQSERQVRVYLILEEISKQEKISGDKEMPQRVLEFILKSAKWQVLG
jgi:FKBP-type peptidyl-prolyl cis-trans isomerase (trigger factor)